MNLTQIVWYSLGIGFGLLFVVVVLSYIASRFTKEETPAMIALKESRTSIGNRDSLRKKNLTERSTAPKIVYVKKHSELKTREIEIKEKLRKERELAFSRRHSNYNTLKAQKLLNGERFTIVNDRMRFAKESYYYVPDYQRRDFSGMMF